MLVVKPVEKSEEENGKKKTIFFHLFIVKRIFPTRTQLNSTSALYCTVSQLYIYVISSSKT